jgi:CspA family cold shock protein
MTTQQDSVTPSAFLLGRVKWFNNSTGYGFITITSGERAGSDIFVHHSSIQVENQQYKYLVQGEYVDFVLSKSTGPHEYQATNVVGVNGGKLMCETRREFKIARTNYREQTTQEPPVVTRQQRPPRIAENTTEPRVQRAPRVRGEGPRGKDVERKEWTLVKPVKRAERQVKKTVSEEK